MSKKGENIYKRKDGRWEARYIIGYSADGSAKYGYCYGRTYRDAKEKASNAKSALRANQHTASSLIRRRFSTFCDEWLFLCRSKVKESTFVKYRTILENHIKPDLGGYTVALLSSVAVEQFSGDLLHNKKLSAKTVRDVLTVLRSIFSYISRTYPGALPSIEISYPKSSKKDIRVLTREEQSKFMQYLLKDMDDCKFGILLALLTGMRIGEICALRWSDISLDSMMLHVRFTMQRIANIDCAEQSRTKVIVTEPKSDTSSRFIPLTDYAAKLCRAAYVSDPDAYVLTGTSDKFMEPRALQYKFECFVKACELNGVHFHTLRHTFATRCIEADFEIKTLSEILGHSNPRVTLERYVHSSLELKRCNMNKLSALGY